ncbi:MAG TPA: Dna2/Cas4 domain-containing protein, partial [Pseudonocardiaceae bacterium]
MAEISVPISALEHLTYCARQAALIHVDDYFASTVDTIRGDLAHAAVDRLGVGQDRRGIKVWRSLPIWSGQLGVHGVCDVVEFTADGPRPVEHKSGRYVPGGPADVQVAAQVLCLREMFDVQIPSGIVFSGKDRHRHEVHGPGVPAHRRGERGSGRPHRRPRIATRGCGVSAGRRRRQRPPSPAAEDRNDHGQIVADALALGSGRPHRRPRIATPAASWSSARAGGSGRPHRRPRIATSTSRATPMASDSSG